MQPKPDTRRPEPLEGQRNLVLLRRSLESHRGRWGFYLLKYNRGSDQTGASGLLRECFTRIQRLEVNANRFPDWADLEHHLASLPQDAEAIETIGLDAWLTPERTRQWNLRRESFAQLLHCPLLIWITPDRLADLARQAPDLWDWRTGVFDFRNAAEEATPPPFQASTTYVLPANLAQRNARIDELTTYLSGQEAQTANGAELRSDLQNELALLLIEANRLEEAETLLRQTLQVDEAQFGPNHPNVARDLNNLAQLLRTTNRLNEAETLMRRALVIDEIIFGPNHPSIATALNNLALLFQDTGRWNEVEQPMRLALKINEDTLGPDHPHVATNLNNLAQLFQDTGRLHEAELLMRRALTICEASLGPEHPYVAISLNNLGLLLQATNRLSEAEPLLRRALAIDEASFGAEHPNVARDLNNLSYLLQQTNRLSEAEPLMRRATQISSSSLVADHPHALAATQNYATLLRKLGGSGDEIAQAVASLGASAPADQSASH